MQEMNNGRPSEPLTARALGNLSECPHSSGSLHSARQLHLTRLDSSANGPADRQEALAAGAVASPTPLKDGGSTPLQVSEFKTACQLPSRTRVTKSRSNSHIKTCLEGSLSSELIPLQFAPPQLLDFSLVAVNGQLWNY